MSKKLNLATLNKKMYELTKIEAQKVRGGETCADRCEEMNPGDPGTGDIYKNGGTKIVNDPPTP